MPWICEFCFCTLYYWTLVYPSISKSNAFDCEFFQRDFALWCVCEVQCTRECQDDPGWWNSAWYDHRVGGQSKLHQERFETIPGNPEISQTTWFWSATGPKCCRWPVFDNFSSAKPSLECMKDPKWVQTSHSHHYPHPNCVEQTERSWTKLSCTMCCPNNDSSIQKKSLGVGQGTLFSGMLHSGSMLCLLLIILTVVYVCGEAWDNATILNLQVLLTVGWWIRKNGVGRNFWNRMIQSEPICTLSKETLIRIIIMTMFSRLLCCCWETV